MPPWVPPGWVLAPGGFLEVVLKGQSPGFAFPVLGAPSWLAAGCCVGAGGGCGVLPGLLLGLRCYRIAGVLGSFSPAASPGVVFSSLWVPCSPILRLVFMAPNKSPLGTPFSG